eukprot:g3820.t1
MRQIYGKLTATKAKMSLPWSPVSCTGGVARKPCFPSHLLQLASTIKILRIAESNRIETIILRGKRPLNIITRAMSICYYTACIHASVRCVLMDESSDMKNVDILALLTEEGSKIDRLISR